MQVLDLLAQHTMTILLQIHMMPLFALEVQVQAQAAAVALNHQVALQAAVREVQAQVHLRAHQRAQALSAPV